MKFAASYSGGKESALSIYEAMQQGHTPVLLITTFNTDKNRSHFHGIPEVVLERVSDSLGIPLLLVKTSGADYAINFEKALTQAKELGAEACIFGDIDIEGHRQWCDERCSNVGIKAMFPLWGKERKDAVYEFIENGFIANITVVNTKLVKDDILGLQLTKEVANIISAQGADICGENGEYHTFVSAGPIFKKPIHFSFDEKISENEYSILPINSN